MGVVVGAAVAIAPAAGTHNEKVAVGQDVEVRVGRCRHVHGDGPPAAVVVVEVHGRSGKRSSRRCRRRQGTGSGEDSDLSVHGDRVRDDLLRRGQPRQGGDLAGVQESHGDVLPPPSGHDHAVPHLPNPALFSIGSSRMDSRC